MRPILLLIFLILILAPLAAIAGELPQTCTYTTYRWSVKLKRGVDHHKVRHPYAELRPEEVDAATGCSVCEEDQQWIEVAGLPHFRLCRQIAPKVEATLQQLAADGVPLLSLTGYRVGMTRGPADADGLRTVFSNHSFGIALDVNAERNGLYDNCVTFGPECRLLLGGRWQPDAPGGLSADSEAVTAMRAAGLRWGGQIAGRQKDFMHFSPTGY
jgi:D-alanyl-D-alanine carboxypeptidase